MSRTFYERFRHLLYILCNFVLIAGGPVRRLRDIRASLHVNSVAYLRIYDLQFDTVTGQLAHVADSSCSFK